MTLLLAAGCDLGGLTSTASPTNVIISDFSSSHEISPVPEPATLLLLGTALTGMGLAYRRRRGSLA